MLNVSSCDVSVATTVAAAVAAENRSRAIDAIKCLSAIGFGIQMIRCLNIKGIILCLNALANTMYCTKVQHLLISYLHESLASNVQCLEAKSNGRCE